MDGNGGIRTWLHPSWTVKRPRLDRRRQRSMNRIGPPPPSPPPAPLRIRGTRPPPCCTIQ
eukprot:scaffold121_cov356-Pavlova_lutheri.AAC.15